MGIVVRDGDYIKVIFFFLSLCLLIMCFLFYRKVLVIKRRIISTFLHVSCCAARRPTTISFGIVSFFFFYFCSIYYVLTICSFVFSARSKLVHCGDLDNQHHNWPLIAPLLKVLCDQVKNGSHPPAENLAIVLEILDKKGNLNINYFFVIKFTYRIFFSRCL